METPIIATPVLQLGAMRLSPSVLRVLDEFLTYPERRSGLVRLADEAQIAMSASSATMLRHFSIEEAVKKKRQDFWYATDLARFDQEAQQRLEPNNRESVMEFQFHAGNPATGDWQLYTNRYYLIKDDFSILYQVGENIGIDSARIPAGKTA